jgi:hypothetical protein
MAGNQNPLDDLVDYGSDTEDSTEALNHASRIQGDPIGNQEEDEEGATSQVRSCFPQPQLSASAAQSLSRLVDASDHWGDPGWRLKWEALKDLLPLQLQEMVESTLKSNLKQARNFAAKA